MIKSKIDARERALELAVQCRKSDTGVELIPIARAFEEYLIGSTELPEFVTEGEMIKNLIEIANKEVEKSRKQSEADCAELLKSHQKTFI